VHLKLVLILVIAGLSVLFVIQNVAVVEVRFFVWELQMTLSLLVFLLFAGGILAGWLLHSYWAYRKKDRTIAGREPHSVQ
jgi:lipopolysaccharide assembly protein A